MADLKKDMEQIAHDIKNKVTHHDDHEDVKKALSHDDKATEFTASVGISSDGKAMHPELGLIGRPAAPLWRRSQSAFPRSCLGGISCQCTPLSPAAPSVVEKKTRSPSLTTRLTDGLTD